MGFVLWTFVLVLCMHIPALGECPVPAFGTGVSCRELLKEDGDTQIPHLQPQLKPHQVWNVLPCDHIIPIHGLRGQDIQTSPSRNSFHNWNVQLQRMSSTIHLAACCSSLFSKLSLSASAVGRSRSHYAVLGMFHSKSLGEGFFQIIYTSDWKNSNITIALD